MEEEEVAPKKSKKPFGLPFSEKIFYKNTKFATFEELIIKLVLEKDKKFARVFFKTFYSIEIWSPFRFLELLLALYENTNIQLDIDPQSNIANYLIVTSCKDLSSEVTTIRVSVVNLIRDWISVYNEFYEDPSLVELLEMFLQRQLESNATNFVDVKLCNILKDKIISFRTTIKENNSQQNMNNNQFSSNIINPTFLTSKYSIETIALQITQYEYLIESKIQIKEYFDSTKNGPNLTKYLSHFSKMKMMIITEITREENKMQASLLVQKAIKIAEKCLEYNNFNTPMEILSALFSPVMIELEKSRLWESLPIKLFESLEKLCTLLSPDDNYDAYKQTLLSKGNFLPLLTVHISEIRFLNEFHRSKKSDLVNLEKMVLIHKEFSSFTAFYAENPFKFTVDEEFQQKFSCYVNQFPEFQSNLYNKPSNYFKDEKVSIEDVRFKFARAQFEAFYIDSMLGIKEDVDFTVADNQMRQRDWVILTTNSVSLNFEKGEVIFKENDMLDTSKVHILSEGKVTLSINNVTLISIKGPAILAESTLIDSSNTFQVTAETPCSVIVVEKHFLFSLLESDRYLSLRFFSSVTIQVIEQLKNSNLRHSSPNQIINNNNNVDTIPTNYRVVSTRLANVKIFDPNLERDKEVKLLFSMSSDEAVIKKYDSTLCGKFNAQGSLYLTQNHVCFHSKVILNKSKIVVPLVDIVSIKKENQKIILKIASKKKHVFRIREGHEEALSILTGLVKSIEYSRESAPITRGVERHSTSLESWQRDTVNLSKTDSINLTEADWEIITRGSKEITLQKNDIVITESASCPKLFRIISGTCRVEMIVNNKPFIIASIGSSEIFGEIGFIQRKGAISTVVIDSDKTQLVAIDGQYLLRLFKMRPELASKFMYHLLCVIRRRLGNRYWYENQEERRVVDIILEPLYNNFGRFAIVPCLNSKVIHSVYGPSYSELEEVVNSRTSSKTYVSALSISTYPIRTRKNQEAQELVRDGHPICDQYKSIFYHNRIIAAIADGCNWGEAPRGAAISAINAFCSYLQNHHTEGNHLQFVGNLVQRAFSMANSAIMLDKDTNSNIGTTTLLGGIILQLESDKEKKGSSNWGFVYGSIGDCKVFHWSVSTGKFSDITQFNRNQSQSATDPGGRLGPHINGNDPDLRNFELGFYPCDEGDYFLLVSDGVHDNLDPALLGCEPKDVGIDAVKWDSITDYQYLEEVKTKIRLQILERIIFKEFDKSNTLNSLLERREFVYRKLPSPEVTVDSIIEYCRFYCQAAITWMQDNPSKRLPKDYKLYPGKMDHTTVMCFVVGHPVEHRTLKKTKKKDRKLSSPLF